MKLITFLLIGAICACASAAQSDRRVSSTNEALVISDYETFISALDRRPRNKIQISDMKAFLDPESLVALRDLSESDEKASHSLFAKCGLLDVKNCFSSTSEPVKRVAFQDIEGGRKLACIAFLQPNIDGGIIAFAYMILSGSRWLLIGTAQHEFDRPSFERVEAHPENSCWKN